MIVSVLLNIFLVSQLWLRTDLFFFTLNVQIGSPFPLYVSFWATAVSSACSSILNSPPVTLIASVLRSVSLWKKVTVSGCVCVWWCAEYTYCEYLPACLQFFLVVFYIFFWLGFELYLGYRTPACWLHCIVKCTVCPLRWAADTFIHGLGFEKEHTVLYMACWAWIVYFCFPSLISVTVITINLGYVHLAPN